jgi:endo-1,4-beta-xylanase
MVDASGGGTGSLMDVMKAAERVGCNYLGVYAVDALRGTRGQANFDPQYEAALAYGAKVMGQATVTETAGQHTAAPARPQEAAQTGAQKKGPATAGRARDTEPSWLMPKVEGANLHYKTFDSTLVGQKVSYLLYLPPGYEASKERRYPVVYWLHGIGGSQQGVPGMTARMTQAINAGKMPPLIMVFVNGMIRSSWVDSADGKTPVESVAIKELIPHVDATYRTIATRAGRMIEGFSMGGGGAAKWGFKHPELFGSISIIDGALHKPGDPSAGRLADSFQTIYGGNRDYFEASNPWNLAEKNAGTVRGRTHVRIVTSTTGLGGLNQEFSELLTRLGVTNEFHAVPDAPHSPGPLYEGIGDKNWEFYRRVFGTVASADRGADAIPARTGTTSTPAPASVPVEARAPQGFQLNGERWTYRDGEFAMSGILLKPEGKGPFPALLISHGLGGSAESFGLNKAREMVKWGFICIAPDYTHSAKFMSGQRPGGGKGTPKGGAAKGATKSGSPAGKGGPAANPQYATYGASEENLRRARVCLDLVSQMPEVDAKRLFAYGHSMGGFVTIGLAASAPDLLRAAAITGSGIAPRGGLSRAVGGEGRTSPHAVSHPARRRGLGRAPATIGRLQGHPR